MKGALILNGERYRGKIIADFVVCCDGGYNKYKGKCDIVVGDMDSVENLSDVEIIRLNPIKDETDGEFGINYLIEKGYDEIDIYGLDGGRLDHIITNISLLAIALEKKVTCIAKCNKFDLYIFDATFQISVQKNTIISLVPFTDEVHILYTKGLQYWLKDKILIKSSSLAISNISTEENIEVGIGSGKCLVFVIK